MLLIGILLGVTLGLAIAAIARRRAWKADREPMAARLEQVTG